MPHLTLRQRIEIIRQRGMTTLELQEFNKKIKAKQEKYLKSIHELPVAVKKGEVRREGTLSVRKHSNLD